MEMIERFGLKCASDSHPWSPNTRNKNLLTLHQDMNTQDGGVQKGICLSIQYHTKFFQIKVPRGPPEEARLRLSTGPFTEQ